MIKLKNFLETIPAMEYLTISTDGDVIISNTKYKEIAYYEIYDYLDYEVLDVRAVSQDTLSIEIEWADEDENCENI